MSTTGSPEDIELEKKALMLSEYLVRDLQEIGLGHLKCHFLVEPSSEGPKISITHNGTEDEGVLVNNLFMTLLREQQWPGI